MHISCRCIAELERIYGIKNGGDRKSDDFRFSNGETDKSQSDLMAELERIYGIRQGGDRANGNNFPLKSQTDIADEIGIT